MTWTATLRESLLSPQVAQAIIAGLFLAFGWIITHRLTMAREAQLRAERIRDVQRALLAEIRAHVAALEQQEDAGGLVVPDDLTENHYLPLLPHEANDRIFRAIVEDVHILPEWVIDPVVRYYRLLVVRAALAQDIRAIIATNPDRAAEMLRDYILLNEETLDTGLDAVEVLTAGLRGGRAAIETLRRDRETAAQRIALSTESSDRKGR